MSGIPMVFPPGFEPCFIFPVENYTLPAVYLVLKLFRSSIAVRYVFFAIVWALTVGRHHFWLLPNLTEECGFFESFVPLYTHEYKGSKPEEQPEEKNENELEKDDGNEEDKEEVEGTLQDNKEESGEEKDHTDKEPWVTLTEEELATARSESIKTLKIQMIL